MVTDDKLQALTSGDLQVTGRLVDASNATLYATSSLESQEVVCIYKPIAGERPLWDFSDGCLAHREYAAYLVSTYLGSTNNSSRWSIWFWNGSGMDRDRRRN